MSASKVSYRVNKKFTSHLKTLGFNKANPPREWVSVKSGALCAIAMTPSLSGRPGYQDVSANGSFKLSIAIEFANAHVGYTDVIDRPEFNGFGVSHIRAALTRSAAIAGPQRRDVWDPTLISPDETIADAIKAIDKQAMPFFEEWTNPSHAYQQLTSDDLPNGPDEAGPAGNARLFVLGQPGSSAREMNLASLAATLERWDDEAAHIERILETRGHDPVYVERLAYLRSL